MLLAYLGYRQFRPAPRVGQSHPAVRTKFAPFELPPLLNAEQPLSSTQLQGKVALLNLWGPWCGFCREEMPHLIQLRQRYPDQLQLVSISYPEANDASGRQFLDETRSLMKYMKQDFPVYQDPNVSMQNVMRKSGIFWKATFPCTVLLDQKLDIRGVWLGYQDGYEDEMQELIEDLVSASQSAPKTP